MERTVLSLDEKTQVERMLGEYAATVNAAIPLLAETTPALRALGEDATLKTLWESEQYSLMAGGKRIRAALLLESCRVLGGDVKSALPLACAMEMVHASSLIHDDLPCMDNDDLRRGKPTNHKVYGEAIALLAGDGLWFDAVTVIAQNEALTAEQRLAAVTVLTAAAGSVGMVGGQLMDLESEGVSLPQEQLRLLHARKTGALFCASLFLGAIAAGKEQTRDAALFASLRAYAHGVGLAFQVLDDILDVTADPALLGKTKGKDEAEEKNSFLKYYTLKEAQALAAALTDDAITAIAAIPGSERLCALAKYLQTRAY